MNLWLWVGCSIALKGNVYLPMLLVLWQYIGEIILILWVVQTIYRGWGGG